MKTLLLYPPITDPTSGYHSLCYIETYARHHGFNEISIIDANIESFLYTTQPHQMEEILGKIRDRRKVLENKVALNSIEQLELYHLFKTESFEPLALSQAISTMRDQQAFYDYKKYRTSVETISNWVNILSTQGYPGQFKGFSLPVNHLFNLRSSKDMSNYDLVNRIAAPFIPYFKDELLPHISKNQYRVIGINITYCSQLPFAIALSRLIRSRFSDIFILFGGTEVADIWKYLIDKSRFFDIFNAADVCVVGEGESAFVRVLTDIKEGKRLQTSANTLVHPRHGSSVLVNIPVRYEDISLLPTPDFNKLPWDKYLSPHPFVYYSPSRGCYWNKCTFCDYGLNFDSPTSPWRQMQIGKIVEDLRYISQKYKYVYFSVDVLAPAMLLKLAERIVEEKIDIRWGAEIRLEKYWSQERCSLLKKSGCTAISVGFESGNQRILDLIDKGTKVSRISETIKNFHEENIGVQMMGFTGFPTETLSDAMDSINFLSENRQYWTFGGLGDFVLTRGAIVAKKPQDFGIKEVRPYQGEDIAWRLFYIETVGGHGDSKSQLTLSKAKRSIRKNHFERPWIGGIDTAHTMFYHDRYGIKVVDEINRFDEMDIDIDSVWYLNGKVIRDIDGFLLEQLFKDKELRELHITTNENGKSFCGDEIEDILSRKKLRKISRGSKKRYFIRSDGKIFPFPDIMLDFLSWFEKRGTLNSFLENVSPDEHSTYHQLLKHSIKHHFLRPVNQEMTSFHSLK